MLAICFQCGPGKKVCSLLRPLLCVLHLNCQSDPADDVSVSSRAWDGPQQKRVWTTVSTVLRLRNPGGVYMCVCVRVCVRRCIPVVGPLVCLQ